MANFEKDKAILSQIVKSREAIKRKYKQLRQAQANVEKVLDETFKPIITPLEKLVNVTADKESKSSKNDHSKLKVKKKNRSDTRELILNSDESNDMDSTVIDKTIVDNATFETAYSDSDDLDFTVKDRADDDSIVLETAYSEEEEDTQSVNDSYLSMLQRSASSYDNTFGVRIEDDVLKIGNSPINFTKKYIKVRNFMYPRTVGLLELLFKKHPESMHISSNDVEKYRKIIEVTNAFRKNYNENEPLRRSTSNKYKTYISPFFNKSLKRKSIDGSGLLPKYKIAKKDMHMDYIYWDDANELVNRLRLLVAESAAGNQNPIPSKYTPLELSHTQNEKNDLLNKISQSSRQALKTRHKE